MNRFSKLSSWKPSSNSESLLERGLFLVTHTRRRRCSGTWASSKTNFIYIEGKSWQPLPVVVKIQAKHDFKKISKLLRKPGASRVPFLKRRSCVRKRCHVRFTNLIEPIWRRNNNTLDYAPLFYIFQLKELKQVESSFL